MYKNAGRLIESGKEVRSFRIELASGPLRVVGSPHKIEFRGKAYGRVATTEQIKSVG